jgi:hypothetical protein
MQRERTYLDEDCVTGIVPNSPIPPGPACIRPLLVDAFRVFLPGFDFSRFGVEADLLNMDGMSESPKYFPQMTRTAEERWVAEMSGYPKDLDWGFTR